MAREISRATGKKKRRGRNPLPSCRLGPLLTTGNQVVSPEGAQNYMVEGVRCATREWKRFATGRPETASWRVNPRAGWQKMIPGHVPQVQLDRAIFCPERGYPVDSADEARKLLSRAG